MKFVYEMTDLYISVVDAIPNELRDHALEVGPALDVDNRGRDLQSWTATPAA